MRGFTADRQHVPESDGTANKREEASEAWRRLLKLAAGKESTAGCEQGHGLAASYSVPSRASSQRASHRAAHWSTMPPFKDEQIIVGCASPLCADSGSADIVW